MSLLDFAKLIGKSPAYVCCIEKGHFSPSAEMMARIHDITNGAVQPNDLVNLRNSLSPIAEPAE